MKLSQIQMAFQAHVLDADNAILAQICSTPTLDNRTRMAIYANAYRARLKETLRTDFPAVTRWLADHMDAVFERYIRRHPSHHFSLSQFGPHLAEFLAADEQAAKQPWLSSLARFEWAFCEAFSAHDVAAVQVTDLAAIAPTSWPHLCFAVHPSVSLLMSPYALVQLWKEKDSDGDLPAIKVLAELQHYIVWRQADLVSHYRSLATDEYAALAVLERGGSFTAICTALLPWQDESALAMRASILLKSWISEGMISRHWLGNE